MGAKDPDQRVLKEGGYLPLEKGMPGSEFLNNALEQGFQEKSLFHVQRRIEHLRVRKDYLFVRLFGAKLIGRTGGQKGDTAAVILGVIKIQDSQCNALGRIDTVSGSGLE